MSNIQIPGYKIIEQIGEGGMSTVFLAEQLSFGRPVALKVLTANRAETEQFGVRFLKEAKIAASLVHPNIVSVFDTGVVDGNYYLAMEYLAGGDLRRRIRNGVALLESLDIVMAMADAIDFASRKGVVHRDIKPANVMFREDGTPAIVDFGIARDITSETEVTRVGTILGTPRYMSPEQCLGRDLDSRSDLYSLGVVFFEMLSGHTPYTATDSIALGMMHVNADIPDLPEDTRPFFQTIIETILAKEPGDRYQSGAELVADIEELIEELPEQLTTTILMPTVVAGVEHHSAAGTGPSNTRRRKSRTRNIIKTKRGRGRQRIFNPAFVLSLLSIGAVGFMVWQNYLGPDVEPPRTSTGLDVDVLPSEGLRPSPQSSLAQDDSRLMSLAVRNLKKAEEAIDKDLLESAGEYIEIVRELELESVQIEESLASLSARKTLREKVLHEVSALTEEFDQLLKAGHIYSPNERNAYTLLGQMRNLQPLHPGLDDMQSRADATSIKRINRHIDKGQLKFAEQEIVAAKKFVDSKKIQPLVDEIKKKRNRAEADRREVAKLFAQAEKLAAGGSGSENNRQRVSIYEEILEFSPGNKKATAELQAVLSSELGLARDALQAGNALEAKDIGLYLQKHSPGMPGLQSFQEEASYRYTRRKEAEEEKTKALTILDSLSSGYQQQLSITLHEQQALELVTAYRAVSRALEIDSTVSGTGPIIAKIDREYADRFYRFADKEGKQYAKVYASVLSRSGIKFESTQQLTEDFETQLHTITKRPRTSAPIGF